MLVKIDVFKNILDNNLVYVKMDDSFLGILRNKIIHDYKSLKNYSNQGPKINYYLLKYEFRYAKYHSFARFYKITKDLDIRDEEFFQNIEAFKCWGSRRKEPLYLPREIELDEAFIEGYALYLAEGDKRS